MLFSGLRSGKICDTSPGPDGSYTRDDSFSTGKSGGNQFYLCISFSLGLALFSLPGATWDGVMNPRGTPAQAVGGWPVGRLADFGRLSSMGLQILAGVCWIGSSV